MPIEAIRNFEVNFFGTLMTARAFAPVIERSGGGAIVHVLSVVALASTPGLTGYNASKAALWSITQSLRGSFANRHIAVHSVFPGPETPPMSPKPLSRVFRTAPRKFFLTRWPVKSTSDSVGITRPSKGNSRSCRTAKRAGQPSSMGRFRNRFCGRLEEVPDRFYGQKY
jgi:NAD(P)-dependent dehydrogenase (short-subunit alcohol dehydrogenase family)